MIVSTYDPTAQARCPRCDEVVRCRTTGGLLAEGLGRRFLDFRHDECGTRWRYYIDTVETELLEGE